MKKLFSLLGLIFIVSCSKTIPVNVRVVLNTDGFTYSICDSAGTSLLIANQVINGKTMAWYHVGGSESMDSNSSDFINSGGKWGILRDMHTPEQDYKIVTEPVFDGFLPFSENIAAARVGHLWGFTDTLGQWVIPAQFDTAHMKPVTAKGWYAIFLNSAAWVNQNGKAFRVDKNGRPIGTKTYHIDPRFIYKAERNTRLFEYENYQLLWKAAWFEEGGRWGILKNDETVLMSPSVSEPVPFRPFQDGAVWLKKGSKYGLWKDGLWVITPHFDIIRVYPTHTWVNVGGRERGDNSFLNRPADMGGTWGLIDSTGKVIIQPGKEKVEFGGESLPVRHNGKWQYFWKGIYLESPVSENFMSTDYLNSDGITITGNNAQVVSKDIRIFLGVQWTELYSCYLSEQKANPELKGKLRWTAVLSKNGQVEKINIQDNTLGENISLCVQDKIRRWIFPVQGMGKLTVQQLLIFTP